jgi:hypothetical protein
MAKGLTGHRRGITLPLVMAAMVFLSVLFFAAATATEQGRRRLAASKHLQAAHWLAVSGCDMAETRFKAGRMSAGTSFRISLQQGQLEARLRSTPTGVEVVSVGRAGGQVEIVRRRVSR